MFNMAAQGEAGGKDEVKTQFATREGTYKLMTLSEYSRPTRVPYNGQTKDTPVRVSFIPMHGSQDPAAKNVTEDKICFNVGKELYVYQYKGVRKAADLTKPVDKRMYKGTQPTCHDFNQFSAKPDSILLLVGFSAGQVQLIDPLRRDNSKIFNDDRTIDKTKVTCIKWIPASSNHFLVSHASGQMYVYDEELQCGPAPPHYQLFKSGDGFSVYTCKTKSSRNPMYRWVIGDGSINEFAFSPCSNYLAVVSQDGFLRVFNYNSMELLGSMKSYFGGLLCVCWSPDGKYIVCGGEDDLITVWSFHEKRVVCRGRGHKSWVNQVAFDPYTTSYDVDSLPDFCGSDDDFGQGTSVRNSSLLQETLRGSARSNASKASGRSFPDRTSHASGGPSIVCYRFGSVSQDTQLCLWDLTEDILRQPFGRHRTSTIISQTSLPPGVTATTATTTTPNSVSSGKNNSAVSQNHTSKEHSVPDGVAHAQQHNASSSSSSGVMHKFATLALGDRKKEDHDKKDHKRNFSLGSRSGDKVPLLKSSATKSTDDAIRLLGTLSCPRMEDVPLLEPLVCKKVAQERLTSLVFREECLVTACMEGYVYTWARPGKVGLTQQHMLASPQLMPAGGSTML